MNGVEILSQTNIYKIADNPSLIIIFACIGFLVGLALVIIDWVRFGFDFEIENLLLIFMCTMIGLLIGLFCYGFTIHETDELDYVEYKVTISEEVRFEDFMDKYKILNQDGKIYTVKERE